LTKAPMEDNPMSEAANKTNTNNQPIDILLVEDNEADIKVTLRAFDKAKIKNNISVARDGEEAIDYIYHQNKYTDKKKFPLPDLILLDIQLPKLDGFAVLKRLKEDDKLKLIPVVMLTSSKSEEDVIESYRDGAVSFIQKPVDYKEFEKVVDGFNFYWNIINKFPHLE